MILVNLLSFEKFKCTDCGKPKPRPAFGTDRRDRRITICLSCKTIRSNKWKNDNPTRVRVSKRRDYEKHKKERYTAHRVYVTAHKEERAAYLKQWVVENRPRTRGYERKYTQELRDVVLKHYGTKCAHCGHSDVDVLNVDHVNEDGAEHRKTVRSHYSLYRQIIDAGFPATFQILCRNCNWKKWLNHLRKRKVQP